MSTAPLAKLNTGMMAIARSTTTRGLPNLFASNRTYIPGPTRLPEVLFLTSFPPRECGIATFAQDLLKAIQQKFDQTFLVRICPLESAHEIHDYDVPISTRLNTDLPQAFEQLAATINGDHAIQLVVIQHEFGFFARRESEFLYFLGLLAKPIVTVFHTVLPQPQDALRTMVQTIAARTASVTVMTRNSARILKEDYGILEQDITLIPHGTHLVTHGDKQVLKETYDLTGKMVLSTFGLLSSGKNIETTLSALPAIVAQSPNVIFLIIGKTHPTVVKHDGEAYRNMLEGMVESLHLGDHVRFINRFLALPDLLEYLQLTDVYLFTSKDPHQAVSGTFSYAISCGCPVISTPIPHALEVLQGDAGIMIDFESPHQLSRAVNLLLGDAKLRTDLRANGLHRMASTAWENAAIAYANLFQTISHGDIAPHYALPAIKLDHVRKMTTDFGMIQFSKLDQPDIDSGYTLDDNARALVAMCQHFELTQDAADLAAITTYFRFVQYCQQHEGYFLNYVDEQRAFTPQNTLTNLADANGRAIWALGYLISMRERLPADWEPIICEAEAMIDLAIPRLRNMHSTRAMAFAIKGLYYRNLKRDSVPISSLIKELANRLVQMYRHEASKDWRWFESYLTYANSCLPEALLCAWLATGDIAYKEIGKTAFDFLLSKILHGSRIRVISNQSWVHKGDVNDVSDQDNHRNGGEQPIDVAYTIIALSKFAEVFPAENYLAKMETAMNWFLGNNHLHQIIYNPCTGGCYDGLEADHVNLNQGAESALSYLIARLTLEKANQTPRRPIGFRQSLSGTARG